MGFEVVTWWNVMTVYCICLLDGVLVAIFAWIHCGMDYIHQMVCGLDFMEAVGRIVAHVADEASAAGCAVSPI
jgi:hypothetical protein